MFYSVPSTSGTTQDSATRSASSTSDPQQLYMLQEIYPDASKHEIEKALSEFRMENMYGELEDQDTSKGKVMSKETSDEYIETKPEALKAIDKKVGRFLIVGKLTQVRTDKINGYLEEDELEYNKKNNLIHIPKCEMC